MPTHDPIDQDPLLEIETIQLNNLFGDESNSDFYNTIYTLMADECNQSRIDQLDRLDIYRLDAKKRNELFVKAMFQGIMNRIPDKDELAYYLSKLDMPDQKFDSVLNEMVDIRNDTVKRHNESRAESIRLTIQDIDRWDRGTGFAWRK